MAAIRVDARASIEHDPENVGGLFGLYDAPRQAPGAKSRFGLNRFRSGIGAIVSRHKRSSAIN
jgi:hypothetical protein